MDDTTATPPQLLPCPSTPPRTPSTISSPIPFSSPIPASPIPLPDFSAFDNKSFVKKRPYESVCPSTPALKCPSTPLRSPYRPKFNTELKQSRLLSNDFKFIRQRGEGSFGVVHEVLSYKDQQHYALKRSKIEWSSENRRKHLREINHLKRIGPHPNIVKLHHAWEEPAHVYIQLELCDHALSDVIQTQSCMSEEKIWKLAENLLQGLAHIHKFGVIHLDIKPSNLLMSSDVVKISDFGISVNTDANDKVEGDNVYMAGELLEERYSFAADIYSAGITLYEVATGAELPKEGPRWHALRDGNIDFGEVHISNELRSLICEMMQPDPTKRPTASQLLQNPYFNKWRTSPRKKPCITPPSSRHPNILSSSSSPPKKPNRIARNLAFQFNN